MSRINNLKDKPTKKVKHGMQLLQKGIEKDKIELWNKIQIQIQNEYIYINWSLHEKELSVLT